MELSELKAFITVVQQRSLQSAAAQLHITPSALSKILRRLEDSLRTPLFDRSGKSLRLNAAGERLRQRALAMLDLEAQTRAEFEGDGYKILCRVAAPAVLQWSYGPLMSTKLLAAFPNSSLAFKPQFESDALQSLQRGECDFALVTGEALPSRKTKNDPSFIALGQLNMVVVAAASHPLGLRAKSKTFIKAKLSEVLSHDFVAPTRSMFCGEERGGRSDGWRDDQLPRTIRYWADDFQVLLSFVKSGLALAYVPEICLEDKNLIHVKIGDCPFACIEQVYLAWRPTLASGWQARLAEGMMARLK